MPVIVPSVSKIIQRIVFNKLYIETLQHYVKSLTKKKKRKKIPQLENLGIDPSTSRMRSGRSSI